MKKYFKVIWTDGKSYASEVIEKERVGKVERELINRGYQVKTTLFK